MRAIFRYLHAHSGLIFGGCGILALLTLINAEPITSASLNLAALTVGAVVLVLLAKVPTKLVTLLALMLVWLWSVILLPQRLGAESSLFWDTTLSYVAVAPLLIFGIVISVRQERAAAER